MTTTYKDDDQEIIEKNIYGVPVKCVIILDGEIYGTSDDWQTLQICFYIGEKKLTDEFLAETCVWEAFSKDIKASSVYQDALLPCESDVILGACEHEICISANTIKEHRKKMEQENLIY